MCIGILFAQLTIYHDKRNADISTRQGGLAASIAVFQGSWREMDPLHEASPHLTCQQRAICKVPMRLKSLAL